MLVSNMLVYPKIRSIMSAICAGMIEYLKEIINSDQFIKQHLQNPMDFLRFNPDIFLINPVKGSYQRAVHG